LPGSNKRRERTGATTYFSAKILRARRERPKARERQREAITIPSPRNSAQGFGAGKIRPPYGRVRMLAPRPNLWLISWTIPVFIVLLWLPIEQELEDARLHFGERASLEARLAVLSKHPDFVVHASSNVRLMGGKDPRHSADYYTSHCLRIPSTPGSKRQNKKTIRNVSGPKTNNNGADLISKNRFALWVSATAACSYCAATCKRRFAPT